jgi:RNA polymerase sigma factor for flagellar operon FliA
MGFIFSVAKKEFNMSSAYASASLSKDELIQKHMSLVKKVAYFYAGRVQKAAEVEDLMQIGMMGLVEAAHNYTPRDGVTFSIYARLRIKGSIVDYLRKSSNLCRRTIKNKQDYDRAYDLLRKNFGRVPTHDEVSKELDVSAVELHSWEKEFAANQNQSMESATEIYGEFLISTEATVEEKLISGELKEHLRKALTVLNSQQVLVIQLYYVEELNVYEIAEVLSVSTGRVSQIKSAAIALLREKVEAELL